MTVTMMMTMIMIDVHTIMIIIAIVDKIIVLIEVTIIHHIHNDLITTK